MAGNKESLQKIRNESGASITKAEALAASKLLGSGTAKKAGAAIVKDKIRTKNALEEAMAAIRIAQSTDSHQ